MSYRFLEFPNQLRVLLYYPDSKHGNCEVSLVMKNGLLDETFFQCGWTHMIEHLWADIFNTAQGLDLQNHGVRVGASTGDFIVHMDCKGSSSLVVPMIDILSQVFKYDGYKAETKTKEKWNREVKIVLHELAMRATPEDKIREDIFSHWIQCMGPVCKTGQKNKSEKKTQTQTQTQTKAWYKHPLQYTWKDYWESMCEADRKEMYAYGTSKLNLSHTVLCIRGSYDIVDAIYAIEKFWKPLKSPAPRYQFQPIPYHLHSGLIHIKGVGLHENHAQMWLLIQLPPIKLNEFRKIATLLTLREYWCRGYGCRLIRAIRERHGLFYRVESEVHISLNPKKAPGYLKIALHTSPQMIWDLMKQVQKEIILLTSQPITSKQWTRVKNIPLDMDTVRDDPVSIHALAYLFGLFSEDDEWEEDFDAEYFQLSPLEVQKMAQKIFRPSRMLSVLVTSSHAASSSSSSSSNMKKKRK